jgi:MinD superfamily P-loop ATPase
MKIAIASGKGGTGKTTLSVNLASFLSENANVVLVDLDVEEPNSGLFINGEVLNQEVKFRKVPQWDKNKCTFCGKCKLLCKFNAIAALPNTILIFQELCHSCYACSELCPEQALPMVDVKMGVLNHSKINENFSFIEGIMDIGQESAVPLIKQTKEYVENNSHNDNIILFDAPPGTSCPVIEVVKDVDFVLLVTEPTPFGLHDLQLAVATVKELNKEFGVVINRHGIGNKNVEEFCNKNKIPILGKIPNMREIAVLYSYGKLLYNDIPEVKEELKKIFETVKTLISI